MPKLWPTMLLLMVMMLMMMTDHELISTVGSAENRTLTHQLLLLLPLHVLLPPQLQNLPVRIRVPRRHKRRARRRTILRHQPPGLEPHTTRIAQRLRPHRPRPPLRRLLRAAVEAFSPGALRVQPLPLLHRRNLLLLRRRVGGRDQMEEARGPVPRRRSRPLAPRLPRERGFRDEERRVAGAVIRGERRESVGGGGGFRSLRLGAYGGGSGGAGEQLQRSQLLFRGERVFHEIREPFQFSHFIILLTESQPSKFSFQFSN